jgi:hypothetical protein
LPKFSDNYIRAFDKMIDERNKEGLPTQWTSGKEVMEWWIYGKNENTVMDGQEDLWGEDEE